MHPAAGGAVLAGGYLGHLLAAISTSIVGILRKLLARPDEASRARLCRGPAGAIVAVAFMLRPLRWRRDAPATRNILALIFDECAHRHGC